MLLIHISCHKVKHFKNILLPSPERCCDLLSNFIPELAMRKTVVLAKELQDGNEALSRLPSNVDAYVTFMDYLGKISKEFPSLQRRSVEVMDL
jgi:hypothetical protein